MPRKLWDDRAQGSGTHKIAVLDLMMSAMLHSVGFARAKNDSVASTLTATSTTFAESSELRAQFSSRHHLPSAQ